MTAGTGVGNVNGEIFAVTLLAGDARMPAVQWKSRLLVVEANIGPGRLDVTGGAIDLAGRQAMHGLSRGAR